ncbi:MAG: tRNA lysidine(34) synthetase TilS [Actinobacteria bacterium]|nr:tRNA lysidine(34) synthetase TilS [Actinomycetota bacterium]
MNNPPINLQNAVNNLLKDFEPADNILVACSGGADSLALAWTSQVVTKRIGLNLIAVIIDHQLIKESSQVAQDAKKKCEDFGIEKVVIKQIEVKDDKDGLEAAARKARYEAFEELVNEFNAKAVLLAHTQDDQAETMLMRLTRGSGAKSLSAMKEVSGKYLRPFLHIRKQVLVDALEKENISYWQDPANTNYKFLRAKVRHELMPKLIEVLGDSAIDSLDRTSELLKEDNEALESIALESYEKLNKELKVQDLEKLAAAIRKRVIKIAALDSGVTPGPFSFEHIEAIDALVTNWRGQGNVDLPGFIQASRVDQTIRFISSRKTSS